LVLLQGGISETHSQRDAPDAELINAMACLWLLERKNRVPSIRGGNTIVMVLLIMLVALCIGCTFVAEAGKTI
jgi:hypothetical protein